MIYLLLALSTRALPSQTHAWKPKWSWDGGAALGKMARSGWAWGWACRRWKWAREYWNGGVNIRAWVGGEGEQAGQGCAWQSFPTLHGAAMEMSWDYRKPEGFWGVEERGRGGWGPPRDGGHSGQGELRDTGDKLSSLLHIPWIN